MLFAYLLDIGNLNLRVKPRELVPAFALHVVTPRLLDGTT